MTTARSDLIDIVGEVRHQTALAYLFNDGVREVWLPKSRVEWNGPERGMGEMTMPERLAMEKELI